MFLGTGLHDRNGRPITGVAIARPEGSGGGSVVFGPWGRWYPWYSAGWGWNVGYVSLDPWRYGTTRWVWGRYGMYAYDPWYDPFYSPYAYGSPYGSSSSGGGSREPGAPVGSVRLRVSPEDAKVYVDGTLHGVVDDFNGLSNHLELEAGTHQLEIKADGYLPYTAEITVAAGKTVTHRADLKKKK